ncbi:transglycosylase domain-containing protein [Oenococcus sicerae]|uniref:Penicillin-binding protein n=1 Tax=Oenococcus sicerae TaxID=2203724 RepID=A0AAJ1VN43_9LACO|nr:transglycosylase domain-containing protein [Oenococcus sicerae]MDN6899824.1 penicillin-binding protein [Oenococcus sicerae]
MSDNSYNPNNFQNDSQEHANDTNRAGSNFDDAPKNYQDAKKMFPDTDGRRPISFGRKQNKHLKNQEAAFRPTDFHVADFSPADDHNQSFKNPKDASDLKRNGYKKNKKSSGRPKKKGSKLKLLAKISAWSITIFALGLLAAMAVFFTYAAGAPKITEAQLASENSMQIFDSQGSLIYSGSQQERDYADQSEIPESLMHAVVSIEDRRFYKHHGVDVYRTIGALFSDIKGKLTGHSTGLQGGSTLTQQLVKLSVFSTKASDQTLKRKAQEAWLALKVERNFSKNQILTFYINKVNMGNGIYGMKTAAEYYFGKNLNQLDLSQLAILAGIPRSPVYYDPYTYPNYLKVRRNDVLAGEVAMKYITQAQADKAMAEPVQQGLIPKVEQTENSVSSNLTVNAYAQSVLSEVRKLGYNPTKDGLKIYTAMNSKMQKRLYTVLNGGTGVPWLNGIQAAATVVNPKNGRVLAQVGGRNVTGMFSLNRAVQTNRSSGSTAKPLVDYGPAIEYLNWPTYRTVQDTQYKYPGTNISVHDFDGTFLGNMTMRKAIVISRNIPAIRTLMEVGMTRSSEFLNKLGINIKASQLTGSSAIGIDVSTEQEAAAFSAFANGGTYYKPEYVEKIVTSDGVTHSYEPSGTRAMKTSTAFMMTNIMEGVPKYNGSAPGAEISGLYQAGKSGIVGYADSANQPSGAESDVWFTGYTKNLAASFWVGYDQPNATGNYIPNASESSMPERAYRDFMLTAMQGYDNTDWTAPNTVQKVVKGSVTEYEVKGASWSNGGLPNAYSSSSSSSSKTIIVTPSLSSSSSSLSSSSDSLSSSSSSASSAASSSSSTQTP